MIEHNEGIGVDAETKAELIEIEARLSNQIRSSMADGIKDIKSTIMELLNKDLDHIKENMKRHDKYHDEHYEASKSIDQKITSARNSIIEEVNPHQIRKDIDSLDKKTSINEAVARTTRNITYGMLAVVSPFLIAGIIYGIIMYGKVFG